MKGFTDSELNELSRNIANKMNMPYCWEDIKYRLSEGIKLPFKLKQNKNI